MLRASSVAETLTISGMARSAVRAVGMGGTALVPVVYVLLAVAALIDARERRFPHVLGLFLACACAVLSYSCGGLPRLVRCGAIALVTGALLVAFELLWRARHDGRAGLGMGDVKFLTALILWRPLDALVAFAGGLICLACAGLIARCGSLPLLPFVVPVFALVRAVQAFGLMP